MASHFEIRNLKGYSLVTTDDGKKLREVFDHIGNASAN